MVEVEDEGSEHTFPTHSSPLDSHNERGCGILIMRALMDECKDTRTEHGIKVRMAKQKAAV